MIVPETYMWNKYGNLMTEIEIRKAVIWLNITCRLWKLRGLERCKEHGFHAQSWIDGKCRKCVFPKHSEGGKQ